MKISVWTIVRKFLPFGGGITGVVDYLLGQVNGMFDNLGDATKEKIVAALNFTTKVLSIIKLCRPFIPVKWQIAYGLTVEALTRVVTALGDLELKSGELGDCINRFKLAYQSWLGEDDETCVELVKLSDGTYGVRM